MDIRNWFKKVPDNGLLVSILAENRNKETLLGIKPMPLPNPEQIKRDAAKLTNYSQSGDYKIFADEVWARVLTHLDALLDPKTTALDYHRGALKEALDLLRLSYQARAIVEQYSNEVPSPQMQAKQ